MGRRTPLPSASAIMPPPTASQTLMDGRENVVHQSRVVELGEQSRALAHLPDVEVVDRIEHLRLREQGLQRFEPDHLKGDHLGGAVSVVTNEGRLLSPERQRAQSISPDFRGQIHVGDDLLPPAVEDLLADHQRLHPTTTDHHHALPLLRLPS